MKIDGIKYDFIYPMGAIREIWEHIGAKTAAEAFEFFSKINGENADIVKLLEFTSACGYYGLKSYCLKNGIECPFKSVAQFENSVDRFEDIGFVVQRYADSLMGFFVSDDTKKKGIAKASQ